MQNVMFVKNFFITFRLKITKVTAKSCRTKTLSNSLPILEHQGSHISVSRRQKRASYLSENIRCVF